MMHMGLVATGALMSGLGTSLLVYVGTQLWIEHKARRMSKTPASGGRVAPRPSSKIPVPECPADGSVVEFLSRSGEYVLFSDGVVAPIVSWGCGMEAAEKDIATCCIVEFADAYLPLYDIGEMERAVQ